MGGGSWTKSAYTTYATTAYNCSVNTSGTISSDLNLTDVFKSNKLSQSLDPKGAIRECRDSEEHPNTLPVIIALDVTGSMGRAATEVAQKLNDIMTNLYEQVEDVEFMFMGIGDLDFDDAPIQATQFESDVRIAEQMDKIYFEFGGGSNSYESYTAAWYFGSRHTDLDCWKRGKKGIIITLGDERLNPHLPINGAYYGVGLNEVLGDSAQSDIDTQALYNEVTEKFDVYHLHVDHSSYKDRSIDSSWEILGDNYQRVTLNDLPRVISDIIVNSANTKSDNSTHLNENGEITW